MSETASMYCDCGKRAGHVGDCNPTARMSDEVVGRVRYALDKQRSWRGTEWQDAPRASLPTADLRTILAALARVTEERDTAHGDVQRLIALNDETTQEWGEDLVRMRIRAEQAESDLATLRERLDKMAMRFRDYGEHTEACDSWSGVSTDPSGCSCGFTAAWYAAFPEDKPAVAVIRGEGKNGS